MTLALWNAPKVVTFCFSGDIEVVRNGEAKAMIVTPQFIGNGYTVQKEIPASDEGAIYVNPGNPAELMINVSDYEFEDRTTGYAIILEEGLVSSNGAVNAECQTRFYLTNTPNYTTVPAPGTTLALPSELDNISVTFSGKLDHMDFAEDKASLRPVINLYKVEGGKRQSVGKYTPVISNLTLELALDGESPEALSAGQTYEVEIPNGLLNFTNDESFVGSNVTILIDDLKCAQSDVEWAPITDYIKLAQPMSLEANPSNTTSSLGKTAMGVIGFGIKTVDFFGISNSAPITYTYRAEETSEPEVLVSFESTDDSIVSYVGRGGMDDSGLIDFPTSNFIYFFFIGNDDGDVNENVLAKFSREGYYTLSIPDGAFMSEGKMLEGTEIVYHYSTDLSGINLDYTLTPADGATIVKGAEVFGPSGSGIVLEFKNASTVDCLSKPATLTCPDGTVFERVAPHTNLVNNFTWTFGSAGTVWADGTYTFTVAKGKIGVDMGWCDEWDGDGNFEGLTAVYTVKDSTVSGVTLIGAESAETYTVHTLGGSLVKDSVTASGLLDIQPGLYIVNGKKTIIRK